MINKRWPASPSGKAALRADSLYELRSQPFLEYSAVPSKAINDRDNYKQNRRGGNKKETCFRPRKKERKQDLVKKRGWEQCCWSVHLSLTRSPPRRHRSYPQRISFSLVFIVSRDQHANRMLRHEKLHFLIINISAHAFTATLAPNIEKPFPLLQFLGAKQPPLSVRSNVCCLICLSLLRVHLSYNILFCLFRLFFCFLFLPFHFHWLERRENKLAKRTWKILLTSAMQNTIASSEASRFGTSILA